MDLAKFFTAVGIAFMFSFFVSSTLSTFYKPPIWNYKSLNDSLEVYTSIYYTILALLGILAIVVGFLVINKESIGAGFIGGGVLLLFFGGFIAAINSVFSSIGSFASGLSGISATETPLVSYLQIIFSLLTLILLIVFAYFKLERNSKRDNFD